MNSEEILRAAVIRFHEMEMEALPSDAFLAERQEVSPEFHRKMMKLINTMNRRGRRRKAIRNVAGVLLGIFTSLILLCSVNEGLRARCLQFLRETVGGMTEYHSTVEPDTTSTNENVVGLKLGYVPDGFVLDEKESSENYLCYYMKNFDVYVEVLYTKDNSNMRVDSENAVQRKVELEDGNEADIYKRESEDDADTLVCKKYGYLCAVTITGSSYLRKEDELLKIADNIRPL